MLGPRPSLRRAFDTPSSRQAYVRRLFSTIAPRYDLITVLLSFGQDQRWKRRLLEKAALTRDTRVLDVACGTGDLAYGAAARGATVTGLDVTVGMLHLARRKPSNGRSPSFVAGDMGALPFPDASFAVVTTGYGLRNVPDLPRALSEACRVLEPGGLLLSLDFNRPSGPLVRLVYLTYLTLVGSVLGVLLHRDPDTYRYIPASIRRYPGAPAVCALTREAGFTACSWYPVLGGLLAIHVARK